jgi:prolyl oligopeptidase
MRRTGSFRLKAQATGMCKPVRLKAQARRMLLQTVAVIALVGLAGCSRDRSGTSVPAPPRSRVAAVTETLHGVDVTDNYRWLEDEGAEVVSWTDAQNRHTRAVLDALPDRQAIETRLKPLVRIGAVTAPEVRGNRYFFARRTGTQDLASVYVRDGALGADRRLVDPLALDANGRASIEWFAPSPDGRILAYAALLPGKFATLRMLRVDGAEAVEPEIENVSQPLVQWLPDASGFIYERSIDPDRNPGARQAALHRMGTPPFAARWR